MLERVWNGNQRQCAWICLNPSTADAETDDPTVRKITGFSARFGYGGFRLFNIFAFRATNPKALLTARNPWGPANEPWRLAEEARKVSPDPAIVAWGSLPSRFLRDGFEVIRALGIARCLGYTKGDHQPRHPLMLPYTTPLELTDPSHFAPIAELQTSAKEVSA